MKIKITSYMYWLVLLFAFVLTMSNVMHVDASMADQNQMKLEELDRKTASNYEVSLQDFKELYPNTWQDHYEQVKTWDDLEKAMSNYQIQYVHVIEDIDYAKLPGTWGDGPDWKNNHDAANKEQVSFKIVDGTRPGKENATINFGRKSFGYYNNFKNYNVVLQNLNEYSTNYYGTVTVQSYNYNNVNFSYHNVKHIGDQIIRSDYVDVYISGYLNVEGNDGYEYNGSKYVTHNNQGNFQTANVKIAPESNVNLICKSDGNVQVINGGLFSVGKNAKVTLDTRGGRTNGNEQPPNLQLSSADSRVEVNEGGLLRILTGDETSTGRNRSYSALDISRNKASVEIKKNGKIDIQASNTRLTSNNETLVNIGNNAKLIVGNQATLNVNASTDSGVTHGGISMIRAGNYSEFVVMPKGNFMVKTNSPSRRDLIYMGVSATFRFNDANQIDLQFTNPNLDVNSSIINMASGNFNVDIQRVKLWLHENIDDQPSFEWTPMFSMIIPYRGNVVTNNQISAASINNAIVSDFTNKFKTNSGAQRLRYEFIPDTHASLEDKDGNILGVNGNSSTNSKEPLSIVSDKKPNGDTVIRGLTVPGSFVRLSVKHPSEKNYPNELSFLVNTVDSPVSSTGGGVLPSEWLEKFTFSDKQTEASQGKFEIIVPRDIQFNAASIIRAYAFKEGKTAEDEKQVQDVTKPTAVTKELYGKKGDPLPNPAKFFENVLDSNFVNLGFAYRFIDSDAALASMNQVGTHEIEIGIKDKPRNLFSADVNESYPNQNEAIFKAKIHNFENLDNIEAEDIEWTTNEIKGLTNAELKEKIKRDSHLRGFTINTQTNEITDKTNNVLFTVPTITPEKLDYEIEFKLNQTIKKIKLHIIKSEVTMKIKYLYKGTTTPIYLNLSDETSNTNTEVSKKVMVDSVLEDILRDNNWLNPKFDGYQLDGVSIVVGSNAPSTNLPARVPREDFEITYFYNGQIILEQPQKIKFGALPITKKKTEEYSVKEATPVVIKNTLSTNNYDNYSLTVRLSVPITKIGTEQAYLGALSYRDNVSVNKTITTSESYLYEVNKLIQELPINSNLNDLQQGLYLQQFSGNIAGDYSGTLEWTISNVK